jgi:hypothetical protein
MTMTRMRLVPEDKIKQIESTREAPVNNDQSKIKNIRHRKTKNKTPQLVKSRKSKRGSFKSKQTKVIPGEVKNLLYQLALRHHLNRQKALANKPILVKNIQPTHISETSTPLQTLQIPSDKSEVEDDTEFKKLSIPYILKNVSGKWKASILELILKSGIRFNEYFEVIVDGERYPKSNISNILQHMVNPIEREKFIPPFGFDQVLLHVLNSGEIEIPAEVRTYLTGMTSLSLQSPSFTSPEGRAESTYNTPTTGDSDREPRSEHITTRRGPRANADNLRKRISEKWKPV